MSTPVRCAAALSVHPVAAMATGEVAGAVLEAIGPEPDLLFLFASVAHTGAIDDIARAVRTILSPRAMVGATAAMVAGGAEEIEAAPALSLLAVRFADGTGPVTTVRVGTNGGLAAPDGPGTLLLLADPDTFPADQFLDDVARTHPALVVLGGLASAARGPGGNRLLLDGDVHHDGAVGVVLPPGVATAVVSQGCRPIGQPMVVTGASGNLLESLASEPALPRLLRLVESLDPGERSLAAGGLHLGRVVDETRATFGAGDFLIRAVLGAVRERQAVAVGDEVPVGTTVQFQVRDADSADSDLRTLLAGATSNGGGATGALLFTCTGRGSHLFGEPGHDAELLTAVAGAAVAGMSCAGELGPVGGRSFLHSFTASVLLF